MTDMMDVEYVQYPIVDGKLSDHIGSLLSL